MRCAITLTLNSCPNALSPLRYEKKAWAKWPKGEEYIKEQAKMDHPLLNR